ncbi:MAG: hypothetical protein EOM26_07690 [Alphaproteobacteria bacterium]|nr:hypothetical protein [Alphaproteobacteria bacterium]
MANKGSSGRQDADCIVARLEKWLSERSKRRDWDEWKSPQGKINRTALAAELEISRSVMHSNPRVKALLLGKEMLWFGAEALTLEAAHAAHARADIAARRISQTSAKLLVRIAELEAENRYLKDNLAMRQALDDIVNCGLPGASP